MKKTKIAIIVSNFNGASIYYNGACILELCLKKLENTVYRDYKIFVADDSSTDKSFEFVENNFPLVEFVVNKPNGGYAQNMNNATQYALKNFKPDYLMLMNNDILVDDPNWLKKLVKTFAIDKKIGILGCQLLFPNNTINNAGELEDRGNYFWNIRGRGEKYEGKYDEIEEIGLVTGAAFLIKSEVFRKIGFLDEIFFMGGDDTDFILRAKDRGYKIYYNGMVRLTHLDSFTSNRLKDEKLRTITSAYCERGAVYFLLKWKKRYRITHLLKLYFFMVFGTYLSITDNRTNERSFRKLHLRFKLIELNNGLHFPLIKRIFYGISFEISGVFVYLKYRRTLRRLRYITIAKSRQ